MNIEIIIKLRYLFTILFGLIFFIGCQIVPVTGTNQAWTFSEAILGLFIFLFLYIFLFSDYMYYGIINEGIKINYKTYQLFGLIISILMFFLMLNVYILGIGVNY